MLVRGRERGRLSDRYSWACFLLSQASVEKSERLWNSGLGRVVGSAGLENVVRRMLKCEGQNEKSCDVNDLFSSMHACSELIATRWLPGLPPDRWG